VLDTVVSQVGGGSHPPASEPERIFREWRQGTLSLFEYQAATAHWVATYCQQYQPRPVPQMGDGLRGYVQGRHAGRILTRDQNYAAKNGVWIHVVFETLYQNEGDVELFRWCEGIMREAKAQSLVERLERHRARLEEGCRSPRELQMAIEVQRKDAEDKRRSS
jgi:hypothetical protein